MPRVDVLKAEGVRNPWEEVSESLHPISTPSGAVRMVDAVEIEPPELRHVAERYIGYDLSCSFLSFSFLPGNGFA